MASAATVQRVTTTDTRRAVARARAVVADHAPQKASRALVHAVSDLVNKAVDQVLLSDQRVTSAAEARQLLKRDEQAEALAGDVQRVVALSVPVVRRLARGARVVKVPWVFIASTTISMGIAVRSGVKEIQALSSLISHRLEQASGAPADPALVKKLAVDLYLHPRRTPSLHDGRLHMVRLTRKWLLLGVFGRKTQRRASRAFDAAERIDAATLAAEWDRRRSKEPASKLLA
jgi:hypothetical protein